MAKNNGGCAYGKVNRQMITDLKKDVSELKDEVRKGFDELRNTNQELYNHLSRRLPPWAVAIGSLGALIIGGAVGAIIKSTI